MTYTSPSLCEWILMSILTLKEVTDLKNTFSQANMKY